MSDEDAAEPDSNEAPQETGQQPEPARFDEALGELEKLVETLEQGDLTLEDSLAHFERGIGLARECRESLQSAEQHVQQLLDRDTGDENDGTLGEFTPDPDER